MVVSFYHKLQWGRCIYTHFLIVMIVASGIYTDFTFIDLHRNLLCVPPYFFLLFLLFTLQLNKTIQYIQYKLQ